MACALYNLTLRTIVRSVINLYYTQCYRFTWSTKCPSVNNKPHFQFLDGRSDRRTDRRTDGRTDGQTDGQRNWRIDEVTCNVFALITVLKISASISWNSFASFYFVKRSTSIFVSNANGCFLNRFCGTVCMCVFVCSGVRSFIHHEVYDCALRGNGWT